MDTFHAAAAAADIDAYAAQMGPDIIFLGTDASERWQGQEFIDFARPYFERGKGWTYTVRERHINLSADGRVAWFDELLDNARLGLCRGSGVLIRQNGLWMIMQYNLGIPVPNDMALELASKIRAAELVK